jgi:glycogen(starch) synthase
MLGWEFPPRISGGLGTACLGITRGLAHHGVDVTLVLPRAFGDEPSDAARILGADTLPGPAPGHPSDADVRVLGVDTLLAPYLDADGYAARRAAVRKAAPPVDRPTGDAAHRVALISGGRFAGHYGPNLLAEVARYAQVVGDLAGREVFDVVHAHDWMTYPAGIAAARASGRPLVVHVHALEFDRCGEHGNPAIVELERRGLAAADRVVCVSHTTANMVAKRYRVSRRKIRVVHNAVLPGETLDRPVTRRGIEDPVVLFLGRVTYQKGPGFFLEAAARVVKALPRVRFVVAGSGDLLPSIVERTAALGLSRHVRFTGFLTGADVERMYRAADVYVMPSVTEPFGIAPLEAIALDVPVIVARRSGVAEVLSSALKVDFGDVTGLADKIVAVLTRPGLRRALVEEGRRELAGMRWERRAERLIDVYKETAA